MKHCAKKLLGLAFALALCLAVGGTALAQTPEFAAWQAEQAHSFPRQRETERSRLLGIRKTVFEK